MILVRKDNADAHRYGQWLTLHLGILVNVWGALTKCQSCAPCNKAYSPMVIFAAGEELPAPLLLNKSKLTIAPHSQEKNLQCCYNIAEFKNKTKYETHQEAGVAQWRLPSWEVPSSNVTSATNPLTRWPQVRLDSTLHLQYGDNTSLLHRAGYR